MLKILMNGLMLLTMLSCFKHAPTIKKPVDMVIISQKFNSAKVGKKYLNYKLKKSKVGEWVEEPVLIPLHEAPNDMMCYPLKTWLKIVKPKLKEGSDHFHDYN